MYAVLLIFCSICFLWSNPLVLPGIDVLFEESHKHLIKDKKIALLTNQTGVDASMRSNWERLKEHVEIRALFCPEHGIYGRGYAFESIEDETRFGFPVYSLHGKTRRPTDEMLEGIDVLIYDIQSTGVRSYTYQTTLFYAMEEAAKRGIAVLVLDRPNPINGLIVDGPMLEEKWRSFIGYINIPYCHGMTIGELASFFNEEYKVGCQLTVIPMKGWKREMSYRDTHLPWIPPSPYIPEPDTPYFYSSTGILGELGILNIGIGFTLPFKIVGAPWINAEEFAKKLNEQKLPGVRFQPFYFRPFWGLYKGRDCEGIMIHISDPLLYRPVSVQFLLLGIAKSLYPEDFIKELSKRKNRELFHKASGSEKVLDILQKEKYPAWKLIELDRKERKAFLEKRKKYLLY